VSFVVACRSVGSIERRAERIFADAAGPIELTLVPHGPHLSGFDPPDLDRIGLLVKIFY